MSEREYGTLRDRCQHRPLCMTLIEHDDRIVSAMTPRDPLREALDAIENMASDRDYDTVTATAAAGILRAALDTPTPDAALEAAYQSGLLDGEGSLRESFDLVPKGSTPDATDVEAAWDDAWPGVDALYDGRYIQGHAAGWQAAIEASRAARGQQP
jgi:hypothetical protein